MPCCKDIYGASWHLRIVFFNQNLAVGCVHPSNMLRQFSQQGGVLSNIPKMQQYRHLWVNVSVSQLTTGYNLKSTRPDGAHEN